ncbi:MAG: DUF11 domain-containing protein [Sphingobacteriales bacterium]|nr:DUF11 domain-containing protein [Sphingobacteriales bacterium]
MEYRRNERWSYGYIGNRGKAQAAGSMTNVAQVSAANESDIDSTPNNSNGTEDDQDSVVTTVTEPTAPVADLSLTKTSNATVVSQGDEFSYTITLSNQGPDAATGVGVIENLPSGLSYVSHTASAGVYNTASGLWTLPSVGAGSTATLNIVVTATGSGTTNNVAQVVASNENDPDSTPGNGDATEDDQDNQVVNITEPTEPMVDLELSKTANQSLVKVGDNFNYTLTLTNEGPDAATGVQVFDLLPSGVSYVSSNASTGTYSPGTGIWNIGGMNVGATATLVIVVKAQAAGSMTNVAQVSAANESDIDSTPNNSNGTEDDQDSVVTTVTEPTAPVADLSLTKTSNATVVSQGDEFSYTITLSNQGPDAATGVGVIENLPSGLSYVSHTASAGVYNTASGLWTLPSVGAGSTATLNIVVTATGSGTTNNVAQVVASNENDPDSTPGNGDATEDDQDNQVVNITEPGVPTADLELTKVSSKVVAQIGEPFTYTITLTNQGPDAATGIKVLENLPNNLQYNSHTTSNGSYNTVTRRMEYQ